MNHPSAFYGAPLILLYTTITPIVHGKNVVLPADVAWLAAFPGSTAEAVSIFQQRIFWWGGAFLAALILGHLSRTIRPPKQDRSYSEGLAPPNTAADQRLNREPKK